MGYEMSPLPRLARYFSAVSPEQRLALITLAMATGSALTFLKLLSQGNRLLPLLRSRPLLSAVAALIGAGGAEAVSRLATGSTE